MCQTYLYENKSRTFNKGEIVDLHCNTNGTGVVWSRKTATGRIKQIKNTTGRVLRIRTSRRKSGRYFCSGNESNYDQKCWFDIFGK